MRNGRAVLASITNAGVGEEDRGKQRGGKKNRGGEKAADVELEGKLVQGSKQLGASVEEPSCCENKIPRAKEIVLR